MAKLLAPLANINEDSNDFADFTISNNNVDANCNVTIDDEFTYKNVDQPFQIENELDFDDAIFTESVSGSLEDLVNTFDEKITKCFHNYDEQTDTLAPVQVRSQDEILSESP